MVQPRASRRRMIVHSSDNEESGGTTGAETQKKGSSASTKRAEGSSKQVIKRDKPLKASSSKIEASDHHSSQNTSKSSSEPKSKSSGKPIYSFFNSATQKLQSSQTSSAHEGPASNNEGIEAIQDDSDGASSHGFPTEVLSKGSSTALTLRKRKFRHNESLEPDGTSLAPTTQKFRKSSGGDRLSPLSVFNEDKRPWTEQFAPENLAELVVHKKKVADVRQWIQTSLSGPRRRVLILKGAAGTGKTTTVALLARALGVDLIEWKDSSPSDYDDEAYSSSAARFEEFVGRAGKSHGLQLSSNPHAHIHEKVSEQDKSERVEGGRPQALLIEEFPNTFSRTSMTLKSFRSTIAQYLATPTSASLTPIPIIMIISETLVSNNIAAADSFTAHRLLGPDLMMNPYLNVIEFNPVAPTFLVKALETIVIKEARKSGRRRTPGPQVLKHLAETGDIRSAISSLEFLCLRGDDGDTWSSKVLFTKSKQPKAQPAMTKSEEEALKLISNRESTLGIFHSVGKVVYNKRIQPSVAQDVAHPPTWLSRHRRTQVPETDVDALIDELGTDTSTFIAALHENYALSCSSSTPEQTLDSLAACVSDISDADLLSVDRFSFGMKAFAGTSMDGLRQDELCFQVAARGILFSLPSPVARTSPANGKRGDAHRMFYPASLKLWRKREEIEGKLDVLISRLSLGNGQDKRSVTAQREQTGVDSWRRPNGLDDASSNERQIDMRIATEAKTDIILDRFPLLAHILRTSSMSPSYAALLAQVADIAQFTGALIEHDEENASDDEAENMSDEEQWTKDLSDARTDRKSKPRRALIVSKPRDMFEGGGLAIPVESRVEKLVLEDDDIIDD